MALLVADGQLGSSSATLLSTSTSGSDRIVSMTLFNTGASEQTINLAITPSSGTSRSLCRFKLEQYEQAYVSGISIDPASILTGYASYASAVDYLIALSPSAQFNILIRGPDGTPKQSADIDLEITDNHRLTMDAVFLGQKLDAVLAELMKIA